MLHQLCYGLGKFSFSVHRNASATSSEWFSRTFGSTVEGLHQSVHFVFMSLDGFLIEDMLVDCDRLRPQQFNTVDLSVEIRVFQSPETEDVQLDSDAFVFLTCTPPPPPLLLHSHTNKNGGHLNLINVNNITSMRLSVLNALRKAANDWVIKRMITVPSGVTVCLPELDRPQCQCTA